MSAATFNILGRDYRVAEPKGINATELYGLAMDGLESRGAMEWVLKARRGDDESFSKAARKLSASPEGRAAVEATLIGSTVDGEVITPATYHQWYSEPGRFIEPYVVALSAWSEFGFFSVTSATKTEPEKDDDPPKKATEV